MSKPLDAQTVAAAQRMAGDAYALKADIHAELSAYCALKAADAQAIGCEHEARSWAVEAYILGHRATELDAEASRAERFAQETLAAEPVSDIWERFRASGMFLSGGDEPGHPWVVVNVSDKVEATGATPEDAIRAAQSRA